MAPGSRTAQHEIRVAPGRVLKTTSVFDTYWMFAASRQDLFFRRLSGALPPWTSDSVLSTYRFTNVYRAADRVSQFLIRHVIYDGDQGLEETFFRTLLFKIFNRIDTWSELVTALGTPTWKTFDFECYASVLDRLHARGVSIYSPAYIMPSPTYGSPRKHRNHLRLLEAMMEDDAPKKAGYASSFESLFAILRGYQSLGDFLAFQFAIDLNYSQAIDFSEMDFVVAGPGARAGIQKCFADTAGLTDAEIIRIITERSGEEFARLGLPFQTLWGRPLQLIDCQNLFCEVDKYARVVHPEISASSGRTRIKQKFSPKFAGLGQWYPPKWQLAVPWFLRDPVPAPQQGPQQISFGFNGAVG